MRLLVVGAVFSITANEGIYASFTDGMAEAAAKLLLLLHKYNLLPQTNTQI